MTARQEILEVARDLTARGLTPFSPSDVLGELRRRGTRYADSTIRTHVVDIMCADSPHEGTVSYADLHRVSRGAYVLASEATSSGSATAPAGALQSPPDRPWSWEGNVQACFVRHLADSGWEIIATSDTAAREQGPDVVARRNDRDLLVEVKGYPDTTKASVHVQARHYVGGALLTGLLAWAEYPNAHHGLVFPDVPTYRKLVRRLRSPLERLEMNVWFVEQDDRVEHWLDAGLRR